MLIRTVFFLLLLSSLTTKGQNYVFIHGDKHEAKKMECFATGSSIKVSLKVANCPNGGGHLIIKDRYTGGYVKGDAKIKLRTGNIIKCYDKGRTKVLKSGASMNTYDLLEKEVNILKRKNIDGINYYRYAGKYEGLREKFAAFPTERSKKIYYYPDYCIEKYKGTTTLFNKLFD